jgi:hypothetical protein
VGLEHEVKRNVSSSHPDCRESIKNIMWLYNPNRNVTDEMRRYENAANHAKHLQKKMDAI